MNISKYMTAVLTLLLCLGFSLNAVAGSHTTMTYHGELSDSSGKPVNATVEASFHIFDAETDGYETWSEPTSTIDIENGNFSVQLGAETPLDDVFDGNAYWLEISLNGEPLTPRTPIESVPYAFRAHTATDANTLQGKTAAELVMSAAAAAGAPSASELLYDNTASGLSGNSMQAALDELAARVIALEAASSVQAATLAENKTDTTDLKTLTQDMKREVINGKQAVTFNKVNVHVRNGTNSTAGAVNGLGNLIVGYDETRSSNSDKSGSHNLVVGAQHNYTSFGGFVAGYSNTISDEYTSVSGGVSNTASAKNASVSGGRSNTARGEFASVSGGQGNNASGDYSSISGGALSGASGTHASVNGGTLQIASGNYSSINGGFNNQTTNTYSTVGGGKQRTAAGTNNWRAGTLLETQ